MTHLQGGRYHPFVANLTFVLTCKPYFANLRLNANLSSAAHVSHVILIAGGIDRRRYHVTTPPLAINICDILMQPLFLSL